MRTIFIVFYFIVLGSVYTYAQTCDYFDSANTTTIPGWTEQSNDWSVESNRLKSPAVSDWNFATKDGSAIMNGYVSGRAIHNGTTQTQFMGVVARYTSDVANIMLKVQDNTSSGYFNSYYLSCDDSNVLSVYTGLNLGTDLNFRMEFYGPVVSLLIDIERDGIWDIDTAVMVTNTGTGLCGAGSFNSCYLDDFCYSGCSAAPDPAGTITGNSYACLSQTGFAFSTSSISGADAYLWDYTGADFTIHGNSNSITMDFGPMATSGILTVSGINDCGTGTPSAAFPVTVLGIVNEMGLIDGDDSVCQGQSTVLYDCGPLTHAIDYLWNYTGTGITVNGNSNYVAIDFAANATSGNLTVVGANACGVGPESPALYIYVDPCTGIDEPENDFSISPNPGNGVFDIGFRGYCNTPVELNVINTNGQIVWSAYPVSFSKGSFMVDLSEQPAGMYIVRIKYNESVMDKKFVITH